MNVNNNVYNLGRNLLCFEAKVCGPSNRVSVWEVRLCQIQKSYQFIT